jgi:hypothetical protein
MMSHEYVIVMDINMNRVWNMEYGIWNVPTFFVVHLNPIILKARGN